MSTRETVRTLIDPDLAVKAARAAKDAARNRLVEVTTSITTLVMVTDADDDDAAIEAAIERVEEPRPAGWTASDEYDGKVVES